MSADWLRFDWARGERTGIPEAVLCAGGEASVDDALDELAAALEEHLDIEAMLG